MNMCCVITLLCDTVCVVMMVVLTDDAAFDNAVFQDDVM